MVTIDEFIKRFKGLPEYLRNISGELLMKHERKIVDLNKAQLKEGYNRFDKIMQNGYSPQYAKKRKKEGLQTSYVDLNFSGKFQKGLHGVKQSTGMDILSDVDYGYWLRGNFPGHAGLTEKNADIIKKDLVNEVAKAVKTYLVQ